VSSINLFYCFLLLILLSNCSDDVQPSNNSSRAQSAAPSNNTSGIGLGVPGLSSFQLQQHQQHQQQVLQQQLAAAAALNCSSNRSSGKSDGDESRLTVDTNRGGNRNNFNLYDNSADSG
jgi:hypothetical protein